MAVSIDLRTHKDNIWTFAIVLLACEFMCFLVLVLLWPETNTSKKSAKNNIASQFYVMWLRRLK